MKTKGTSGGTQLETEYRAGLSKSEAFELAKKKITPDVIKSKGVTADVSWSGDQFFVKGKGFNIDLSFEESRVQGSLKLGILLKAAQGRIHREVQSIMDKLFS